MAEAVAIQSCKADTLLNSKSEWEQPAVERLIVTRELPDQDNRRGGGGLRGRGTQVIGLQARVGAAVKSDSSKGSQVQGVAGGAFSSPMAALKASQGQLSLIFTPVWFFDVIQFSDL